MEKKSLINLDQKQIKHIDIILDECVNMIKLINNFEDLDDQSLHRISNTFVQKLCTKNKSPSKKYHILRKADQLCL